MLAKAYLGIEDGAASARVRYKYMLTLSYVGCAVCCTATPHGMIPRSIVTETMQSKKPFLLFLKRSSAEDLPIMSSHLRPAGDHDKTCSDVLFLRVILIMPLELGAQIHCLQLFGGIKGCLSSRVKARRNVLTRESHSLEVLLRQLMVKILL